jgi:hypothetical protein
MRRISNQPLGCIRNAFSKLHHVLRDGNFGLQIVFCLDD